MPTNNVQALLSTDIHDPTDFPVTDLRQLDGSLRCTICSEFYDAPITLACGHCFCSLCIREHIAKEQECPSCRKPTADSHFRLNPALEEAVAAWKTSRSHILRLSQQEHRRLDDKAYSTELTPRRFQTPSANGRKRKRRAASEGSDIVCIAGPSNSNVSSDLAESSPLQAKSARKQSKRPDMEPSSDPQDEELYSMKPDSLINCPACNKSVEYQLINRHMDGPDCGSSTSSKSKPLPKSGAKAEWSKILGNNSKKGKGKIDSLDDATERLPKVSYTVLRDKALKDLLISQKLPVSGDRNAWITRHQRWVMIFNANLDKAVERRKGPSALRLDLKKWEEDKKGQKYVIEDVVAHEVVHKDDFKKLVEQARRSRAAKSSQRQTVETGHVVEDSEEEHL
ncbi:hypothetical protein F5I97DRAFT_1849069 [Phlebopus sp. FC_14]|nr:hypothetical protein F5I97DRAFT_1849069 [Phlebopus sp. FC_14]